VAALGPAEGQLRSMIGKLYAVAEAYPQLKANESFQQLQSRISGLENGIADRREFYNESVNLYNTSIQQFPGLMMARLFAFQGKPLLEFGADEKRDVDMKALFT
jgi:LemA protein